MEKAIEFKNIDKKFPGVWALKDVSFSIGKGEVHALLGENGAGKSTLLNILHGVYPSYEGDVFIEGNKVAFKNTNDAIINGRISMVHQEVNIVPELTVGQNITLGYEPVKGIFVDYNKMNKQVDEILQRLNCSFNSSQMANKLTAAEMQMLAIAKALFHKSKIISLDEPTTSLTNRETTALFKIINDLKTEGITILYVSHRLEEIFEICDKATILRDGQYITTLETKDITREELIKHMVGREVNAMATRLKPPAYTDDVVLEVKNLSQKGVFNDIDFTLKKGEILGFSGLVGSGRTEIMRAIFGADPLSSGSVFVNGKQVKIKNTQDALRSGIGLLPEERKTQGFIRLTSNVDNASLSCLEKFLSFGFVDHNKKLKNYVELAKEMKITPKDPEFLTQNMSGGNQQKVIIARWLSTDVDIIIFDEPTKGVDVAAKAEIYRLMENIVNEGKSIIVISSELPEVMGISDRIIVMCEGRKTAELSRDEFDERTILSYAMGGKTQC